MMANPIHAAKSALRKAVKERLAAMTEKEKLLQSDIVTEKLKRLSNYQRSQRVSIFLSMKDEIQTYKIMENLFAQKKDCFIPQYFKDDMKMVRLHSVEDYHSLPETKWKIKQPALHDVREDALETGGLDLILMPGLGFTKNGYRLGRGKGYYDKYLRKCQKSGNNPATVALTFAEQILENVPMTDTDIPVDLVLYAEQWEMDNVTVSGEK